MSNGSGWTIDTYSAHNEALREAEMRFQVERDRRYNEVNIEKEKALKIKETADLAALQLARDIQIYKDEKANELREQISSERGSYATKDDLIASTQRIEAVLKPMQDYIASHSGREKQSDFSLRLWIPVIVSGILMAFMAVVNTAAVLWAVFGKH